MARVWKARLGKTIAGSNPALSALRTPPPGGVLLKGQKRCKQMTEFLRLGTGVCYFDRGVISVISVIFGAGEAKSAVFQGYSDGGVPMTDAGGRVEHLSYLSSG
jgi:hypothetical protein